MAGGQIVPPDTNPTYGAGASSMRLQLANRPMNGAAAATAP